MGPLDVALALLGGLLLVLNLSSSLLTERVPILSQPFIATAFGVAVGPAGLGLLTLSTWGDPIVILEHVARVTVGFAVVGIALRIPLGYVRDRAGTLAVVLGPGMLAMWGASAAIVALFLDVRIWTALLIGAIVTPTDPVIANTIVTGSFAEERIPERIRRVLSAEAGANDGLAYPIVMLAILALQTPLEGALTRWLVDAVLVGVVVAVVFGAVSGAAIGYLEREAERHGFLDEPSVLTVTVALTVTVLGVGAILGTSDVLAAFVAGLLYNHFANPRDEAVESEVQDAIKRLLTIPAFVVFGAALPWTDWFALGAGGLTVAVAILLFRRLPAWLVLGRFVRPLRSRSDALFAGWFGPIGVAALLYATVSVRETGSDIGWVVASLVIAASIVAHGATATPLTNVYGR
ncbi:cation:proton antiporter domain-containing protein [Natronorubrum halophilum]|uniref:cation:proton antiporter domain-containing protein n=1 Tax=Natronorubrum halophilum TaxID=1702106 RepID=UPI000EF6FB7F|nr:cation:proton antiporter [Natronorubrum halophilum]